ncbi:MAG: hypothetical protein Q4C91_12120 [Eubacteriales bacterium]|nr:hypothetical protein [Eubacteriales bacterium]
MKKRKCIGMMLVLFSIAAVCVYNTSMGDISAESSVFSDATLEADKDNDLSVISDTDMSNTIEFYKLKGESDAEAEASAKEYLEKRQGLYLAAIDNGYAVSDEEVWEYLSHLREQLENADNSEEYYEIKSAFPSDEDYWNYEFTVYKKNLPIQKYLSDYAEQYSEETGKDMHSQEFNELWNEKLEELKTEMREKYVVEFESEISD